MNQKSEDVMTTEKQSNSPDQEQKISRPIRPSRKLFNPTTTEEISRSMMPLSLRPTKSIKKKDSIRPSRKY